MIPPHPGRRLDAFDLGMALIVVLWFVAISRLPFGVQRFGDLDYHADAKSVASAMRGLQSFSAVRIHRAPAPVFYYAVPYALVPPGSTDDSYWSAALAWSALWMIVSVLLIRRAAESLGGVLAGRLAAVLTVLSPFGIYYSFGVLAEPPAFLGASLFTFGWSRWRTTGGGLKAGAVCWLLCWGGLALLLTSRPNSLFIVPIGFLAAAAFWLGGTRQRREAIFTASGLCLSVGLVLCSIGLVRSLGGGWQNGMLSGIVVQGRYQYRNEPWNWRPFYNSHRGGVSQDYMDYRRQVDDLKAASRSQGVPLPDVQWRWIAQDVAAHPWLTLRATAIRGLTVNLSMVNSASPDAFRLGRVNGRLVYSVFHVVVNAYNLAILIAAVIFVARTPGAWRDDWVLWGPWLALSVFAMLTLADHRYTFPGRPGLVILAAMLFARALAGARESRGERSRRAAAAAAALPNR